MHLSSGKVVVFLTLARFCAEEESEEDAQDPLRLRTLSGYPQTDV